MMTVSGERPEMTTKAELENRLDFYPSGRASLLTEEFLQRCGEFSPPPIIAAKFKQCVPLVVVERFPAHGIEFIPERACLFRDTSRRLRRRNRARLLLLRQSGRPLATALQYQSADEFRHRSPFLLAFGGHFAERAAFVHLQREPLLDADLDADHIELVPRRQRQARERGVKFCFESEPSVHFIRPSNQEFLSWLYYSLRGPKYAEESNRSRRSCAGRA